MTSIRALGLTAVLVLAIAAGASPAAASTFQSGDPNEEPSITGATAAYQGSSSHRWLYSGGELECPTPSATGQLEEAGHVLRVSLTDQKCGSASFKYNGCGFAFYPGREVATGKWQGKMDITDAPGKTCSSGILIKDWTLTGCEVTLPPDEFIDGVTFEEVKGEPEKVQVNINTSFEYFANYGFCLNGKHASVGYIGAWEFSAKSESLPTPLYVESPPEWGEPGGPLDFEIEFEEYGNQVLGTQGYGEEEEFGYGTDMFALRGISVVGDVLCGSTSFVGDWSGGSVQDLNAVQEECVAADPLSGKIREAEVHMNGCQYALNPAGTMSVSCPAGEKIEIKVFNSEWCTYTIDPQSGVGAVEYTNIGSGFSQGIEAKFANGEKDLMINRTSGKVHRCGTLKQATHHTGVVTMHAESALEEPLGLRIG